MFNANRLVFYYAVSPVHMGAGQATGAVDNPIQREVHTGHPVLAGSGIKGAVRHHLGADWGKDLVNRIFGPDRGSSDHAGALAFTDAALVAFPVRSLRQTFVYATCPAALARLKRLAGAAAAWDVPEVTEGTALLSGDRTVTKGRLVLEAFDFEAHAEHAAVADIAAWLSVNALPDGKDHEFFRNKLRADLVVLSDAEFAHFARNATVVEPHVRIDSDKGTASPGGLFYTENLPPETLLAGLALASAERRAPGKDGDGVMQAEDVLARVFAAGTGLGDALLQVGGDASTGRGLVVIHVAGGKA